MMKKLLSILAILFLVSTPLYANTNEATCNTIEDFVSQFESKGHPYVVFNNEAELKLFDEIVQENGGPPMPEEVGSIGVVDIIELVRNGATIPPFARVPMAIFGKDGCYLGKGQVSAIILAKVISKFKETFESAEGR